MTTTERKYAKHLGKLFLLKEKHHKWVENDKLKFYWMTSLIMVGGLKRKYGSTGCYVYSLQTLKGGPKEEWRKEYTCSASAVMTMIERGTCLPYESNKDKLIEVGLEIEAKD